MLQGVADVFGAGIDRLQEETNGNMDRNHGGISIENFSADGEADDMVEDNFFFYEGKPAWFDFTLEGQWAALKQSFKCGFFSTSMLEDYQDIVHHRRPPQQLNPTQMQLWLRHQATKGFRQPWRSSDRGDMPRLQKEVHERHNNKKESSRSRPSQSALLGRAFGSESSHLQTKARYIRRGLTDDRHTMHRIPNV